MLSPPLAASIQISPSLQTSWNPTSLIKYLLANPTFLSNCVIYFWHQLNWELSTHCLVTAIPVTLGMLLPSFIVPLLQVSSLSA